MADPTPSVSAPSVVVPAVPAAPPEAIALELGAVEKALAAAGTARFLDLSGRFSFEDRQRVAAAVADTAQKTGSKVYVLALPGKTDVNAYASIHADLKLQQRDVLLIFSADKRHLHSQAIPKTVGNEILKETNKEFYKSQPNGVVQMLDQIASRLSTAATTATAAPSASTAQGAPARKPMLPVEWVLIAIAVAVIAYLLLKTNRAAPAPPPKRAAKPREDDSGA